jgi:hypothetical protein
VAAEATGVVAGAAEAAAVDRAGGVEEEVICELV